MPLPPLGVHRRRGRERVGTTIRTSDDDPYHLCRHRTRQPRRRPVLTQEGPCSLCRSDDKALRAASPVVTEDLQPSAPLSDEKLVSAVPESASVLQEAADSSSKEVLDTTALQGSTSASPGTAVPPNIVDDASWRSSTFSCEKLVAGAPESASAQTLGEEDDVSSLEELINTASSQEPVTASPPTAPCNNTLDGSSTTYPFRHDEKTVAGVAESHAHAMRELELELDQFIEELLGYSSSEDQTTTTSPRAVQHCPRTAPCNKSLDGSSSTSPFRHEKTVAGVAESAHAQSMQELELDQFIEELLGYTSPEDRTTTSPRAVQHNAIDGGSQRMVLRNTTDATLLAASSLGSKILSRRMPDWFYWYYIRMDRQGSFRMYPDLGGPFQSLQEAEDAISRHYDELWRRQWQNVQVRTPHGGPYSSTRTKKNKDDEYRYLAKALLDQYNEENNLFGNLAHELDEDVVMEQWIYEDHTWYYHYNFTTQTKKKEAGDISLGTYTFFAEVSHKQGEDAMEVNCCCKMEDEDNGWCYGCKNNGSHGMRHPKNLDAYTGGHKDVFLPFDLEEPSSSDDEDAKETRLRNISEDNSLSCVYGSLLQQQASTVEGY